MGARNSIRILPSHMSAKDGFRLRVQSLQETYEQAQSEGVNVRAIMLTSPNNPTGIVYSRFVWFGVVCFGVMFSV